MMVYCRSCNRDVKVDRESMDSYIEKDERTGKDKYHEKKNCDITT